MSKSELLAAGALRLGTVTVARKEYQITEASAYVVDQSMKLYKSDGILTANAFTVCQCVLDGNGNRLFTDADLESVKKMSPAVITKIAAAIGSLSEEDEEKN